MLRDGRTRLECIRPDAAAVDVGATSPKGCLRRTLEDLAIRARVYRNRTPPGRANLRCESTSLLESTPNIVLYHPLRHVPPIRAEELEDSSHSRLNLSFTKLLCRSDNETVHTYSLVEI